MGWWCSRSAWSQDWYGARAVLRLYQRQGQCGRGQPPLALHRQNHLKELFEESSGSEKKIEDFATPHPSPGVSAAYTLPTAGKETVEEDNARKGSKGWISRDVGQDRTFGSGPRQRTADRLVSTTDPDATPFKPR